MYPELLEICLKENKIVAQHLDSYNRFLEQGMQNIISSVGTVDPNVPGYKLKLGKVWVEKPVVIEADSSTRPILPVEARLRNLTYAGRMYLELTPILNDIERKTCVVYVGDMPIMIRSRGCYTDGMSTGELIKAGEDSNDPGGYFIVNGTERVLVGIEDLAPNKIMTTKERKGAIVQAKVFSTRAGFRSRCALNRSSEGVWTVDFPAAPSSLSLILILRALGVKGDEKLMKMFSENRRIVADLLLNSEVCEVKGEEAGIDEIGKRAAPGQPKEYRDKRAETLIDTYLLPHLGIDKNARPLKAKFLCQMAERTTAVAHGKYPADDKDHYSNKRIKLSGVLMEELYRYAFQFLVRDITYQCQRAAARGRRLLDVQIFVRPDTLSERIKYAMATGNWIAGQTGVCQLLDRTSFISALSHLRRVISPLSRVHPHFEARDLHGTHYGRLCPCETPEGGSCSLVKNMAILSEITIGVDEKPIEGMLRKMGVKEVGEGVVSVYINGCIIGMHNEGDALASELLKRRRMGEISHEVNFGWYKELKELYIYTDGGRSRRPLVVVENGSSKVTQEIIDGIKKGDIEWGDLLRQGIVEYLDADEEDTLAFVALSEKDLTLENTHVEIDPVGALSVVTSQLPMQEYSLSPRITMACAMYKQSIGVYATNYRLRADTRSYVLYYPQKPIVYTRPSKIIGTEERSGGENFVVAVMSYKGFNMCDGIVLNKAALDRGLARAVMFRSYETEERRYPGGQRDKLEIPAPTVSGYREESAYKFLGEDGIILPGVYVKGREVLIGKSSPPRFLEEVSAFGIAEEKKRESSVTLKAEEKGVVDCVFLTQTPAGNKLAKVRIRDVKIPENGDKFASRHGQKGVVGLVAAPEDMPFSENGIVPDLLLNPHAIPSRMTVGHMLEMLAGKAGSVKGERMDGTPFSGIREEELRKILEEHGFHSAGHEVLYDGESGRRIDAEIFVGVCFYQRLHHLVSNKIHARSRGPVQLLTRQPTEGRVREGGLRFGEMERDCLIGYGASALLKERLVDESDRVVELVCENCGSVGMHDWIRGRDVCPACSKLTLHQVEMSYAFKLLLDEIKALGVFPRIILGDKTEL